VAAALWLELAASAQHGGDESGVKRALEQAHTSDPNRLRAWPALLPFLEAAGTPVEFASALEDLAGHFGASRADCLLTAALVTATDAGTVSPEARNERVQLLLRSAREAGADVTLVARLSSMLAHLLGDPI